MATCSVDTLMEDGNAFAGLTEKQQSAIQIALLREIAGNTQTLDELIAAGNDFISLTPNQQAAIQIQLLCEISQA